MGTQIVTALTSGLVEFGKALAETTVNIFDGLVWVKSAEGAATLSGFAEVMLVFAGISIACAIFGKLFSLVRSRVRKSA